MLSPNVQVPRACSRKVGVFQKPRRVASQVQNSRIMKTVLEPPRLGVAGSWFGHRILRRSKHDIVLEMKRGMMPLF